MFDLDRSKVLSEKAGQSIGLLFAAAVNSHPVDHLHIVLEVPGFYLDKPGAPSGAIVEAWFGPTGAVKVRQGLVGARRSEKLVVEIWCDATLELARERFMTRLTDGSRHPGHNINAAESDWWDKIDARPLDIGVHVRFLTAEMSSKSAVRALADNVRFLLS